MCDESRYLFGTGLEKIQICDHLKPILEYEISIGNEIKEISDAWTNTNLAIDMKKSMNVSFIKSNLRLNSFVECWENSDSHYSIQEGFYCNECKNSIAGPK